MVRSSETIIAEVKGKNGTSEIVEFVDAVTNQPSYEVRFMGRCETFKSMGEAYITAKEKADYKD